MKRTPAEEPKPERLYYETYLAVLRNSPGTKMFRNFYVRTANRGEFDALEGGKNSCAFFVSSVLTFFKKIEDIHGTVESTQRDLENSEWQLIGKDEQMKPGDVLIWQAVQFEDGPQQHIGFYIGNDKAVSTSLVKLEVTEHDIYFGNTNRRITRIYRMNNW